MLEADMFGPGFFDLDTRLTKISAKVPSGGLHGLRAWFEGFEGTVASLDAKPYDVVLMVAALVLRYLYSLSD